MADGAGGDRRRQVGREAGARHHLHLGGNDAAVVAVAHFVLVVEAVALTGDHHVVVAVGPQLDRAAQARSRYGGASGPQCGLRLLAAEATAHAAAFDHDVVRVTVQGVGDHVLHFGRVLSRAVDQHAAAFLGNGIRDLAFQVELLLTADVQLAFQLMPGALEGGFDVAACQVHRRHHEGLRLARRLRREDCWQFFVFDLRLAGSAAGVVVRVRDHDENGLADILNQSFGQNRVVVDDGAAVVGARDILVRIHGHHARRCFHRIEIHRQNIGVCLGRGAQRGMQRALRLRDVVSVGSFAQNMQHRRFVFVRLPDFGPCHWNCLAQEGFGFAVHAATPSPKWNALIAWTGIAESGLVSSQKRRSRFCAVFMR